MKVKLLNFVCLICVLIARMYEALVNLKHYVVHIYWSSPTSTQFFIFPRLRKIGPVYYSFRYKVCKSHLREGAIKIFYKVTIKP